MPNLKSLLPALLLALPAPIPADEPRLVAINPALLYYQAFALVPTLSEGDKTDLFTTDWRGRPLDPRLEPLLEGHDNAFKLHLQAARSTAPCDWGYDLGQGPDLLMPGLARSKAVAQVARLRFRWHLGHGRQEQACDDYLAGDSFHRRLRNRIEAWPRPATPIASWVHAWKERGPALRLAGLALLVTAFVWVGIRTQDHGGSAPAPALVAGSPVGPLPPPSLAAYQAAAGGSFEALDDLLSRQLRATAAGPAFATHSAGMRTEQLR
ncbi:MAG TPA: hypothetical protein DCM86_02245 [Verrucomicrobiales bacterium]|nr:hypothetical protein [Verrucomicrobiales bacterium]